MFIYCSREYELTDEDIKKVMIAKRNANLKKLPDEIRDAVKLVFWEGKTYHEVGSLMGYSDHGMWSKIRREIDKI